jgi:tight adherence protein B
VSLAAALAFAAGALAALGTVELALAGAPSVRKRLPRGLRMAADLADAVVRVGSEGRAPGTAERRRLLAAGAAGAFGAGTFIAGPLVGSLLGTLGPWAVSRMLKARREHYRRSVDAGAGEVAIALADALSAGYSMRGAVAEAARGVGGQAGHELRRVAAELAAGAPTTVALGELRDRTRSAGIGTVVTACLIQRGAGGDLARLLRDCATTFGDQARLEGEVRAATAQARFTGVLVVLLPLGGAVLAELASPGFVGGLLGSWLTAWLVGLALVLQALAAVAIGRLGRVAT